MVSEALLKTWGNDHRDWPRHPGAVGEAATLGGMTLKRCLCSELGEFGVVSQREGTFERWMSSMMSAPIVGSLAGNVLKRFRVELDYPHEKLYLSAAMTDIQVKKFVSYGEKTHPPLGWHQGLLTVSDDLNRAPHRGP
jgi:hypothetical protein